MSRPKICRAMTHFWIIAGRKMLAHIDAAPQHSAPAPHGIDEAEAVTVGDA